MRGGIALPSTLTSILTSASSLTAVPSPTWGNHLPIARDSGLEPKPYRYFDPKTVGLDFKAMKEDIQVRRRRMGPAKKRVI